MSADADCEIAIIGGGLAGLTCASLLVAQGRDVRIFEAADTVGGRIQSVRDHQSGEPVVDLGPTWIWPPYQPTVTRWVDRLGIQLFAQYESGSAILDLQGEELPRRQILPGQHGMSRIVGGPQAFVDRLVATLAPDKLHTRRRLKAVNRQSGHYALSMDLGGSSPVLARKIVIAAPLRPMAQNVAWNGILDVHLLDIMKAAPTWMAKQTKVVISYSSAFWREAGLSGRVASQLGPLSEIHDHCSADGKFAALIGFVGWPERYRDRDHLEEGVRQQLERCFGSEGSDIGSIHVRDWSESSDICSQLDQSMPAQHPDLLPADMRQLIADGTIAFAVAETGSQHPGLIDGALESGERAAKLLTDLPDT